MAELMFQGFGERSSLQSQDLRLPNANPQGSSIAGHPGHMALRMERLTRDDHLHPRSVCTRLQPCLELTAVMYVVCRLVTMRWLS